MTDSLGFGLAKSMVDGALTNVKSAIQEEAKLRRSAKRDLVLITDEFEMMRSFFVDATAERVDSQVAMTWVRQVRDLAYDVEDCIGFVVHLDQGTRWWWRMVPSCMAPAIPLNEAVEEIDQLKARMECVCIRNTRYNLNGGNVGSNPPAVTASSSSMLALARDAARRQQGPGDLTQLITNKGNADPQLLQVISVWGTGGDLGTTSIIRKAYNDPEICQNFACRAWVKLTHPFNPDDFLRHFMAQVYAADACRSGELQGADVGAHVLTKMKGKHEEDLLREFVHQVNTKTYLVVLDNLTDMLDWDAVRTFLPDMGNGSWIIVSTHHFEIASLCIGHSYQPMELKHFSSNHSVCAFFKEGSQHYGDIHLESVASQVSQNSSYGEIPSDSEAVADWMSNHPLVGRDSEMNELRRSSTSVIIVITTEASVATYCANNKEQVLNVKGLEAAAAFDLFRKEWSPLGRRKDAELIKTAQQRLAQVYAMARES